MSVESQFTREELQFLKQIVGRIIPASPVDGLPGADDEQILSGFLDTATANSDDLKKQMHDLAVEDGGLSQLLAMDEAGFDKRFAHWANRWPENAHPFFALLMPLLLRVYYQDPRVHAAHGRRPGAPFPEGYVLIAGDWSLLDKVRARPPLYRR